MSPGRVALLGLAGLAVLGCGSSSQTQPPGVPPTPTSVSVAEPGGDAHDAHWAALTRQLSEPWGERNDKDDQIHLPLPDWEHWKRVRYWGVKHFVGFRYGDDHHVVAIGFVLEVPPGSATDVHTCMRHFEGWARPQMRGYEVKLTPMRSHETTWRDQPIVVKMVDGYVDTAFSRKKFSAAWAAIPAYPDACFIYAVAVPWRDHEKLAKKVRDRWVNEAFDKVNPLTQTHPERK